MIGEPGEFLWRKKIGTNLIGLEDGHEPGLPNKLAAARKCTAFGAEGPAPTVYDDPSS